MAGMMIAKRTRFGTALIASLRLMPVMASAATPAPAADESVFDLPLSSGDHQRVLFAPVRNARGTIVMLPGGAGDVGLRRDGDIRHDDNFVIRTRALWNRHGYNVLIPDTIDGANLRGLRSSPDYGRLVDDLAAFARQKGQRPVFLLGTSQGSIAAMNGAAHAAPGSIAGVVLTESVSVMGGSGETVFDATPQRVRPRADRGQSGRCLQCRAARGRAADRRRHDRQLRISSFIARIHISEVLQIYSFKMRVLYVEVPMASVHQQVQLP